MKVEPVHELQVLVLVEQRLRGSPLWAPEAARGADGGRFIVSFVQILRQWDGVLNQVLALRNLGGFRQETTIGLESSLVAHWAEDEVWAVLDAYVLAQGAELLEASFYFLSLGDFLFASGNLMLRCLDLNLLKHLGRILSTPPLRFKLLLFNEALQNRKLLLIYLIVHLYGLHRVGAEEGLWSVASPFGLLYVLHVHYLADHACDVLVVVGFALVEVVRVVNHCRLFGILVDFAGSNLVHFDEAVLFEGFHLFVVFDAGGEEHLGVGCLAVSIDLGGGVALALHYVVALSLGALVTETVGLFFVSLCLGDLMPLVLDLGI